MAYKRPYPVRAKRRPRARAVRRKYKRTTRGRGKSTKQPLRSFREDHPVSGGFNGNYKPDEVKSNLLGHHTYQSIRIPPAAAFSRDKPVKTPKQPTTNAWVPRPPTDPALLAWSEGVGGVGGALIGGTLGFLVGGPAGALAGAATGAGAGFETGKTFAEHKTGNDNRSWKEYNDAAAKGASERFDEMGKNVKSFVTDYDGTNEIRSRGDYVPFKTNVSNTGLRRRSTLRGRGDYSSMPMQTNQLVKGSGQKPLMVNSGKDLSGDVYLSHREFIGNVKASATGSGGASGLPIQSTFNVETYPINAAIFKTFPWLSQTAQNWVLYEFAGLVFEFRPTSGEYGNLNTNALGKVIMATQYDPDAPSFISSVQMENYDYATACKPSEHMLHGVETKNGQRATNMLYTRTVDISKDKIFTDLGTFQIATEGVPLTIPPLGTSATANIGELWVSYRIKLSRANIYSTTLSGAAAADLFLGSNRASGSGAGTVNPLSGSMTSPYLTSRWDQSQYIYTGVNLNFAAPSKWNTIGCTLEG